MRSQRNNKSINYIRAMKMIKKKPKLNKSVFGVVFSFLLFIALLAGVFFFIEFRSDRIKNEISEINEYINDEENRELYNQSIKKHNTLTALEAQKNELVELFESWNNNPGLSGQQLEQIINSSETQITITACYYDADRSELSLELTTINADQIYNYLDKIMNIDIIGNIDYSGYKVTSNGYSLTVTCHILATAEGDE